MLGGSAHDFGKRPILLLGDFLQTAVKGVGKLNLRSRHDVIFTSALNRRQKFKIAAKFRLPDVVL
jgi:hypothetical protein